MATRKFYAVLDKRGNMIRQENNHLHPLLIFDTKSGADNAIWNKDEKVVSVQITVSE